MATSTLDRRPSNDEDLEHFFRKKLFRELSQLFKWENLPNELPYDYMEHALIRKGKVMFFYDDDMGYMTLACSTSGTNVYNKPITARAIRATTSPGLLVDYERTIVHRYDELIDDNKACVLIENMYGGESMTEIIDFYAKRLANLQRAFDTNSLWQNLPPIFTVNNNDMKLSVLRLFDEITKGKPWVIVDKEMMNTSQGVPIEYIDIKSKLAEIYDAINEIYNSFKETVGIDSPGADKKERLITDEVNSNKQSIQTCLQIMLTCREVACEEISKVFGLDVKVDVRRPDNEKERGEENGTIDDRVEEPLEDEL